jgi:hypothetical protein
MAHPDLAGRTPCEVSYSVSMYFYHEGLVNYALDVFRTSEFGTAQEGNRFFEVFAPGNTTSQADRPFERFSDYEELLVRLMEADHDKWLYSRIYG